MALDDIAPHEIRSWVGQMGELVLTLVYAYTDSTDSFYSDGSVYPAAADKQRTAYV